MKPLPVVCAVVLLLAAADAHAQCPLAQLDPSSGGGGDEFGAAVALDGDWAAVGAANADMGGTDRGAVYVFERDGAGAWIERQVLVPSDPADFDRFGWSVALEGDLLVAGVLSDDDLGFDSGSVYLFEHDGGAWVETQKLIASNGGIGDLFGISVAVSNGRVVIGACQRTLFELFGLGEGSVYVFERSGGTYAEVDQLFASDRELGAFFGAGVHVNGDRIVVGAEADDEAALDAGALYVFDHVGASWTERAKLTAEDAGAGDFLGMRVRVEGDRILAGAPMADVGGVVDAGSAYVFDGSGGGTSWTQSLKVVDPSPRADDRLGLGLDLDGDLIVVGAPGAGPSNAGRVQLLRDEGGLAVAWTFDGAAAGDEFGFGAALEGDRLLYGARSEGGTGRAHEFRFVPAEAVERSDPANPTSLSMPPPRLGRTIAASVALGSTTGHSFAGLVAFAAPANVTLPGGQVLLVDVLDPGGEQLGLGLEPGPTATFDIPVPGELAFCGRTAHVQAVHVGGGPFALSNAFDVVLGS